MSKKKENNSPHIRQLNLTQEVPSYYNFLSPNATLSSEKILSLIELFTVHSELSFLVSKMNLKLPAERN